MLLIAIPFGLSSQINDSIILPKGDNNLEITSAIHILDIYVTNEQKVYCNGKQLQYFDEISAYLIDGLRSKLEDWTPTWIYLQADKNLKYAFIDRIKSEICRVSPRLVYGTGQKEELNGIIKSISGTTLSKLNQYSEEIMNVKEEAEFDSISKSYNSFFMPLPPPEYDEYKLARLLYENDIVGSKQILEDKSYSILKLVGNNKYSFNSKDFEFSSRKNLLENLTSSEIVMMTFNEQILYEDYIDAISIINKLKSAAIQNNQKVAFIIEISMNCQKALYDSGLYLFEN